MTMARRFHRNTNGFTAADAGKRYRSAAAMY
jgi:hypothetical protein